MKIVKLVLVAAAAVFVLPACTGNQEGAVTRAELEEVRTIAKKARACCESNTARIDRMFEKAMAK